MVSFLSMTGKDEAVLPAHCLTCSDLPAPAATNRPLTAVQCNLANPIALIAELISKTSRLKEPESQFCTVEVDPGGPYHPRIPQPTGAQLLQPRPPAMWNVLSEGLSVARLRSDPDPPQADHREPRHHRTPQPASNKLP
jgi:hypothetical protein